jgi:hypothetical protein
MRGLGIFGAVAVLAFAGSGVCAQTAATAPVGKPLALLAGLPPPHEGKHKDTRHLAHAKAAHEKTAAKTHGRLAAHTTHTSATKLAARHHGHHEQAVTASAFADEPPPQATPTSAPAPTSNWPVVNSAPTNNTAPPMDDAAIAPAAANAPANADAASAYPDPGPAKVETIKITAANATSLPDRAAGPVAPAAATTSAIATATPVAAAQTVLAAPVVQEAASKSEVGSASWIAQVLAAFGGAVAAGAVAWFLIGGSRPIRTYG